MKKSDATIILDDYEISKRPNIKPHEKIRLWVRSGGRCAICNKYLLDLDYDVSIGEMAHIGDFAKAEDSIRGQINEGNDFHREQTKFKGNHYVECYIVKDDKCVALDRQSVIIV